MSEPSAATATPDTDAKFAPVPVPSPYAHAVVPAIVVTVPATVSMRRTM